MTESCPAAIGTIHQHPTKPPHGGSHRPTTKLGDMVQRPVLPLRADLRTRRERVIARTMSQSLRLIERLQAGLLPAVPPRTEDDFYRVPEGLEGFRLGDVLDSRAVVVRAFRQVKKVDAWQVKFRSTDTNGAALCGVTTVMIPRQPFKGSVRPLLSYQSAIDSLSWTNDPSYTLRHGDQAELPVMARAFARGWAVVCTDYTGPHHAFGAGHLAAHLVLDGIRAAISFEPTGFDAATPIGLWGYSGGAQATLCAAEQHPGYAAELNIVGAAAGGMTVDPTITTYEDVYDGSFISGIPFGALIGISREFSHVDLLGALTPQGQVMAGAAADMNALQLMMSFPFLRWANYLTVPSVLDIPGLRSAFESNRFGQATPKAAMYVYHGIHEQNLPIAAADDIVATYRANGVDVTYNRSRFGGHMTVALTGVRGALRFLSERFRNTAA